MLGNCISTIHLNLVKIEFYNEKEMELVEEFCCSGSIVSSLRGKGKEVIYKLKEYPKGLLLS